MSRVLRSQLLYNGCYAHVISRSIRKLKLFHDAQDFLYFKELIERAKQRRGFKIFHYCLMQTHFHLAVQMGNPKEFSFAVRDIKREYAYRFHTKYKLSGPIWRERFKSLLIENEEYLYACGRYIENNPLRAKLVNDRTDWIYSSSRHYEMNEGDGMVDRYEKNNKDGAEDVNYNQDYEVGSVIGSDFFRFQFLQSLKQVRPGTLE